MLYNAVHVAFQYIVMSKTLLTKLLSEQFTFDDINISPSHFILFFSYLPAYCTHTHAHNVNRCWFYKSLLSIILRIWDLSRKKTMKYSHSTNISDSNQFLLIDFHHCRHKLLKLRQICFVFSVYHLVQVLSNFLFFYWSSSANVGIQRNCHINFRHVFYPYVFQSFIHSSDDHAQFSVSFLSSFRKPKNVFFNGKMKWQKSVWQKIAGDWRLLQLNAPCK